MKRVSLIQVGMGTVGGAVLEQVLAQHDRWCDEFGLDIRIAAIASRAGAIVVDDPTDGLPEATIRSLLAQRRRPGTATGWLGQTVSLEDAVTRVAEPGDHATVLLDAAAGRETALADALALRLGGGVVLSNKAPLALPWTDPTSVELWQAVDHGRLRYEATCGAGLPVISTLRGLLDSGDRIVEVTGCLSGTLGAIFSMVAAGESFSEAVRDARGKGYTEPDPRDDLSGLDVARKALILARTMGIHLDLADIDIQSLIPEELAHVSVEEFLAHIDLEDGEIAGFAKRARHDGAALKYVASVIPAASTIGTVGLRELPTSTMLGALQGPENIVSFRTERYDRYPLVVSGPGAGAAVTAAGMVVDMLALAQQSI